jgi:hypothetical protein
MRKSLETTGIGQTELSAWLGQRARTVRHYVKGDRRVPPALSLLLEYLEAQPEALTWFRERAKRQNKKSEVG